MDAYTIKTITDIALTIASIVLPTLAGYLVKQMSSETHRKWVVKATDSAFTIVAGLAKNGDNQNMDKVAEILARVADELNGLNKADEALVRRHIDKLQNDPFKPSLPNYSPSIQIRGASAVIEK